ncbi:AP-3 complex subunit beta [Vanrija albida]|uniref:AP-3 complex subunit beta n=1 Tax=Vanrija albida TaxID=181172 RepID=A0ABR3PVH0_9TREE
MINRLGQRLKENFQETTRDLNLLAGGGASASAAYFDASEDKMFEITKLLESRAESERLEGMKRIIAAMSKGRNMEGFFAQVVKNVVANSIEIRKLVYIYLLRFANNNSDLLLLSINTFQKDLSDANPLIRSMSLRVLTSIRVPVIQGIVMLGLKKLVNDRNPYVRKTVAGGLSKVYDMDSTVLPELLQLLRTLLASNSPLTLGPTLTAFSEICPDRLDLLHPYYRHICKLLVDADEWGQSVILDVLTRYARTFLEKPDTAGAVRPVPKTSNGESGADKVDSDDEFEGLDIDLAMLLHYAKSLFHSRNPTVVLAVAKLYYNLAPAGHASVGQELLVDPLLRVAGSASAEHHSEATETLAWEVIASMAEERPWLFAPRFTTFFLHSRDCKAVKKAKLRGFVALADADNATTCLRELKAYVNFPDDNVAEEAVRAIGHCVRTQPSVVDSGLKTLMRLLKSTRGVLVAHAVIELKGVILSQAAVYSSTPQHLVARLAKQLDNITNPSARASVFWLAGQFAADDSPDTTFGLKWPGLAPWVPDVLRKGAKSFITEEAPAKLQIITLASKLLVLSPGTPALVSFSQYLFTLARYDHNFDVRDRARFLNGLLRGVREEKQLEEGIEDEEQDAGGVTLRREQIKVVLLGKREPPKAVAAEQSSYDVGSMSRITHRKLGTYESLPDWTDDPTDPSLRESELEKEADKPPVPTFVSSAPSPIPPPIVRNLSTPNASTPRTSSPASSVPHTTKAKFRDLDDFLNSEESEEETDEEDSDEEYESEEVVAVSAPPAHEIVPEYDTEDETSEEEEDEEEEEESSYDEYEVDEREALQRH